MFWCNGQDFIANGFVEIIVKYSRHNRFPSPYTELLKVVTHTQRPKAYAHIDYFKLNPR